MKKLVFALIFVLTFASACACAETAYVSISNGAGELVLAREAVELSDADGDGTVTISDALYLAHENTFEGGAAAGYLSEDQGYGLSLCMLWGEDNGGSFGYYLNNASPLSLLDPVADGDHVKAYVYADLTAWSDTYCYFDKDSVSAGEVELTLTALVFDANWVVVPTPVEGAMITIDGADSGILTDAEGKAVLTVADGTKLISARSDSAVLVPPVCVIEK